MTDELLEQLEIRMKEDAPKDLRMLRLCARDFHTGNLKQRTKSRNYEYERLLLTLNCNRHFYKELHERMEKACYSLGRSINMDKSFMQKKKQEMYNAFSAGAQAYVHSACENKRVGSLEGMEKNKRRFFVLGFEYNCFLLRLYTKSSLSIMLWLFDQ